MEEQIMDPPAIEAELQGIHIALPTQGTDQTDPKMLMKAVRHHRIPVGGLPLTLLSDRTCQTPLG